MRQFKHNSNVNLLNEITQGWDRKKKISTECSSTDINASQFEIFVSESTFTHQQIISKCLAKMKKIKLAHEGT